MNDKLTFVIFCIEEYKNNKNLTGSEVMDLFNQYSICNYIEKFYEVLHTTGTRYIIDDIDSYIRTRQDEIN